jgi:hypothetical protein
MVEENEDPFNSLGFGVVAYLRMVKNLMIMFLLFSILIIPAIYLFVTNDGLTGLNNYSKAQFSLGNLGFSRDVCRSVYLGLNKPQSFQCQEGTITKLNNYGLLASDFTGEKDFCGDFKTTFPNK